MLSLSVIMIVNSLFCHYGAELVANQATKEQNSYEKN